MGIEFIRGKSGRPYIKRWARGLDRLKTPTLFDSALASESRTLTATLTPGCAPKPGDAYLVQATTAGGLVVLDGHRQIAHVPNPPSSVTQALVAHHGMAPVTVERVGALGTIAELKLQ